jgi:hypothetical protein
MRLDRPGTKSVSELLAEHAMLMNRYGADSPQAREYLEAHRDEGEFVALAETARALKLALTARPRG